MEDSKIKLRITSENKSWSHAAKFLAVLAVLATSFLAQTARADNRESAARLYLRLAGKVPSKALLDKLEGLVEQNNWNQAAAIAMAESSFYNVTLKNWVTPWTNRDRTIARPLNDMSATIIGIIRDEDLPGAVPFDDLLGADILYVPGPTAITAKVSAFAPGNNNAYSQLEISNMDLRDNNVLQKTSQSAAYAGSVDPKGIAGVISTRQWASEFFSAGTNRRSFRFTAINFLCKDFEDMFDTSPSDEYVTRDVDRAPGGDPQTYLRRCIGCHAGLNDPFRKAFAYYDFGGLPNNGGQGLVYTPGVVPQKMNDDSRKAVMVDYKNATLKDDNWFNLITVGKNANLGWNAPRGGGDILKGEGAMSLGRVITATDAFAKCVSHRVFDQVCIRKPTNQEEQTLNTTIASYFKSSEYKVKPLFSKISELCLKE